MSRAIRQSIECWILHEGGPGADAYGWPGADVYGWPGADVCGRLGPDDSGHSLPGPPGRLAACRVLLLHVPGRAEDVGPWHRGVAFWQPVTGGIEEGEEPVDACRREVLEETGLIAEPVAVRPPEHRQRFHSTNSAWSV